MTIAEILPAELWERMEEEPFISLIDVRHMSEVCLVGWADLTKLDKDVAVVTLMPTLDDAETLFIEELKRETNPEHEVWFISRNEKRARLGAQMAAVNGWQHVGIVTGGFEGPLDEHGHRSSSSGWRAAGLPWQQR